MKKITLIALMLFTALGYAQVGINTNNPDASSALEIESTTGGILIPRLTETQRDDISAPATGLMIYQTDQTAGFYFYDGNIWTKIDGVAGPQGPAGLDGTNGTNGTDGADGTDGTDGVDGAPGLPGADGTDGVDGAPGLPGPSGADGTDGVDGLPGAPGLTGAAGTNGTNGTDGAQGLQGLKGDDGDQGEAGPQGPAGPTGPIGPDGDCGLDGNSSVWKLGNAFSSAANGGYFDLNGPITTFGNVSQININVFDQFSVNMQTWLGDAQIGDHVTIREQCVSGNYGIYELTSIPGIPGTTQSWGLTFLSGTNTLSLTFATEYIIGYTQIGPSGPTGSAGPQGLQGIQGIQGEIGLTGATGPLGPNGTNGINGIDGNDGDQGVAGPQGLQGIQGIQGEIGLTGATGPLGANGTNGINGIDGNDGDQGIGGPQGLQGIQGIQGDTGLQGSAGLDGSPFTLINGVPTCESAQLSSIGSIVLDNSNSNGSLHVLTPGPDCSVDPTKLFSVTQPDSGVENVRFYWFFNVSESIYVYDLPEILRYGADSHTVLYKLSDYYETSFDPNADGFNISSSLLTSYLNSSNFILLEPGYTYCLLSGNVSNYNNPNHYSNTLPEYDSNLFLTLSQWKLGWGGGMYIQTNRWALGVVGEQEGFSYKPVGKIWQTIINW